MAKIFNVYAEKGTYTQKITDSLWRCSREQKPFKNIFQNTKIILNPCRRTGSFGTRNKNFVAKFPRIYLFACIVILVTSNNIAVRYLTSK